MRFFAFTLVEKWGVTERHNLRQGGWITKNLAMRALLGTEKSGMIMNDSLRVVAVVVRGSDFPGVQFGHLKQVSSSGSGRRAVHVYM